MDLSSIARKNVRGNMYRYIMYSLSNAFAITVFFIFYNYSNHPALKDDLAGSMGSAISNIMTANRVIIVLFSLIFVGYSTKVFLSSRGREFGLFSLYGMTRKQLRKFILTENLILSFISVGLGLGVGVLFSKLFFMIMSSFLGVNFEFFISLKALVGSFIIFIILFFVINLYSVRKIKSQEIIDQIKIDRKAERLPEFSKFKAFLGIFLLLIGYGIAAFSPVGLIILMLIPVTLIVILGTYFTFKEFSIFLADKLLNNERFLYKKNNIVTYSHIAYKLKDTVNVMVLVAILGAVTLTATGTMYSFYTESPKLMGFNTYGDMMFMVEDESQAIIRDQIEKDLERENIDLKERLEVGGLLYNSEGEKYFIISNTDYNSLAKLMDGPDLSIKTNEVFFNYSYSYDNGEMSINPEGTRDLKWDDIKIDSKDYILGGEISGSPLSVNNLGYRGILILNDGEYKDLVGSLRPVDYISYNFSKPKNALEINKKYYSKNSEDFNIESKLIRFEEAKNTNGLVLFIGFFTASLFFIAAGSILYFKLFNNIEKDRQEYNTIRKIGATNKEINRMVTKEIGIMFFIPFIFASLHSIFAMAMLSNLLMSSVLKNGLLVSLGYLLFQIVYFIVLRKVYIDKLKYK